MASFLLIHGVGGAKAESQWINPLNRRLTQMSFDAIKQPTDTIAVASYRDVLLDDARTATCAETYRPLSGTRRTEAELHYALAQKALEREVRPHAESSSDWAYNLVPMSVAEVGAAVVEFFAFEEVSQFLGSAGRRGAVWQHVLDGFPADEPIIVIGRSLGSIVAAGLLRRLPKGRAIDLFITIGSPLRFARYHRHLAPLASDFPYDRVRRWLNVYSPSDAITGGRGLGAAFPQALDLCATGDHSVEAYMSHPGVASAVGHVVFGHSGSEVEFFAEVPARPMHRSWYPLLLGSAFSLQLSKLFDTKESLAKQRLDVAREEVARRAVRDIQAAAQRREAEIGELRAVDAYLPESELRNHPLADGRYPTERDLTVDAASLLRGEWKDSELLSIAVALLLQPIVAPFDIQVSVERRVAALQNTLNVVRDHRGNLADKTFADQVRSSVEWAQKRLADSGGFPLGTVLIGAGLVLLAATGVGLAVAAPAGLAGAAVVTSTLAAFGPGGMVGGLLTLTALTGTATGLGAYGAAMELEQTPEARDAATVAVQSGETLAASDLNALTVTLTGVLAVVHAQPKLGFESTESIARIVIVSALDTARAEHRMHQEVAPNAKSSKEWGKKVFLLTRALDALDTLDLPRVKAVAAARRAIEAGNGSAVQALEP